MLCCVNDCGRDAHYRALQLCQKHYFRQWRYGTTELTRSPEPRHENPSGYQWIYAPDHPLRHKTGKYVAEHRAVLYADIGPGPMDCELCGKYLTWATCKVDHIDENVRNNARSNLRPTCNRCNTRRSMPAPVEWNRTHVIEFEGVRLTPAEWARDPRVKVAGRTIVLRKLAGMSDADALFAPKATHNGNAPKPYQPKTKHKHERKNAIRIEIDGVIDTAAGWARHPDCEIGSSGITWRIRQGWDSKQAVFQRSRG
jgi:hypothetical protein